jgi:hypothetical protein
MSRFFHDDHSIDPDLKHGAVLSLGIHFVLLVVAFLGLPEWFRREEPQPLVITLEMLPITGVTNVKPSDKPITKPTKKPPVKTKEAPTPPASKPKTATPEPAIERVKELMKEKAKPTPKEVEEKPDPKPVKKTEKPKPEEKPIEKKKIDKPKPPAPEKPKEEKREKPDDDEPSLDEVLKDVKNKARTQQDKDAKPTKKSAVAEANATKSTAPYDATKPLSLSERDAIVSQFVQCWNIPAGSANDFALRVGVDVALRPDGSVIGAALAPEQRGRYGSDMAFRAAADSAVRAVYKCNPIQHLPTDKYNSWKEMRLNFDPSMQLR